MKILIDQAGFINKGAELMLCSVIERVKQRYPDAQILVPILNLERGGYEYCCENNIRYFRWGLGTRLLSLFYSLCISLKLMRSNSEKNFVMAKDVDVVIDAGGFRYGDQWSESAKSCRKNQKYYASFRRDCKIIFLPQSFGAFENQYSKMSIQRVLQRAGLIYAREEVSLGYLLGVASQQQSEKIRFKRDFTLLHKYNALSTLLPKGDYIVFILNKKMVTHSTVTGELYIEFMGELIRHLHNRGEQIILLNHEGDGDKRLCEQINEHLNLNLPILSNLRAMLVKNIIGNSKLVVSSRFHGVVSGIVQRVPTFCTSWSHKYNELLSVYSLEDNMLDLNSTQGAIEKLCAALDTPLRYTAESQAIEAERESIEEMWSEVFEFIEQS